MPSTSDPSRDPGAVVAWAPAGCYPTRALAQLAASILEGHGYQVRLLGDDAGGVLPHLDALRGGVEVQVPDEDVTDAAELLADLDRPAPTGEARGRALGRTIVAVVLSVIVLVTVAAAFLTGPSLLDL